MEKKNEYVITIGFNKKLEEHRKVAGILNGMGRTKAQYIVNAVIAYGEEGGRKYGGIVIRLIMSRLNISFGRL